MHGGHVLFYLSRLQGLQFKSPLPPSMWTCRAVATPSSQGTHGGSSLRLQASPAPGVVPLLLCHGLPFLKAHWAQHTPKDGYWAAGSGTAATGPQAAAQDVLFRVAWAHFCRASRETAPLCRPARVGGASRQSCWAPEGFTGPLPLLSSWGWKSHGALRGT